MIKRAQAWSFDVMISSIIFIAGIIIFFLFSLNFPNESQERIESFYYEANIVADSLLTEGFPGDWNENNVVKIGLISENKINETKLERIYIMANPISNSAGYNKSKSILDTSQEYFFNFSEQMIINGSQVQGVGLQPQSSSQNLIKISRLTIYKNKPVRMDVYLWEM